MYKWSRLSHGLTIVTKRYSQLDLEDLHNNEDFSGITLNMQDRQRYFEGRSLHETQAQAIDVNDAWQQLKSNISNWSTNLGQVL